MPNVQLDLASETSEIQRFLSSFEKVDLDYQFPSDGMSGPFGMARPASSGKPMLSKLLNFFQTKVVTSGSSLGEYNYAAGFKVDFQTGEPKGRESLVSFSISNLSDTSQLPDLEAVKNVLLQAGLRPEGGFLVS
jgi:hypothetical protein